MTSTMEAPSAPQEGTSSIAKLTCAPVSEADPERREQEQRRQLERGQRRDRAGAEPDAERIEARARSRKPR